MVNLLDYDEVIVVPAGVVDLDSFREWVHGDEFPEHGHITWIRGEVWVEMGSEQLFSHLAVKKEFAYVLTGFEKEVTQKLTQWHDAARRHGVLIHRVLEIGGCAELSHGLVMPAFGLREHRRSGQALRFDLVGPVFVAGFQSVAGGGEFVYLGPSRD